jgi:hypothetical protein
VGVTAAIDLRRLDTPLGTALGWAGAAVYGDCDAYAALSLAGPGRPAEARSDADVCRDLRAGTVQARESRRPSTSRGRRAGQRRRSQVTVTWCARAASAASSSPCSDATATGGSCAPPTCASRSAAPDDGCGAVRRWGCHGCAVPPPRLVDHTAGRRRGLAAEPARPGPGGAVVPLPDAAAVGSAADPDLQRRLLRAHRRQAPRRARR